MSIRWRAVPLFLKKALKFFFFSLPSVSLNLYIYKKKKYTSNRAVVVYKQGHSYHEIVMLPKSRLPFFGSRFIGHTTARYKESGRSCLFKTAVKVGNKNRPQFYVCNLSFFTTIRKYITLIGRHNNAVSYTHLTLPTKRIV